MALMILHSCCRGWGTLATVFNVEGVDVICFGAIAFFVFCNETTSKKLKSNQGSAIPSATPLQLTIMRFVQFSA